MLKATWQALGRQTVAVQAELSDLRQVLTVVGCQSHQKKSAAECDGSAGKQLQDDGSAGSSAAAAAAAAVAAAAADGSPSSGVLSSTADLFSLLGDSAAYEAVAQQVSFPPGWPGWVFKHDGMSTRGGNPSPGRSGVCCRTTSSATFHQRGAAALLDHHHRVGSFPLAAVVGLLSSDAIT
jgi:hypothetical protein